MYLSSEVDGALPVDRIPPRRIGNAGELYAETEACRGVTDGLTDEPRGSNPGRIAGCAATDLECRDGAFIDRDLDLWCSELVAVCAEADLPRQATSRRWREGPLDLQLLSRGNQRDVESSTEASEVEGQVGV